MPVERIDRIAAERGDTVVVIPVFGAVALFGDCLRSVLEHTDAPVLVADDGTPGDAVADAIEAAAPSRRVLYLRRERNAGFVVNVNGAFDATAPADVVVLNSDCVVGAGWLEGLRAAAQSDTRIATASALADRGSILSVPSAAGAVRDASQRRRPRIPTAIGHCFYVTRAALELVGGFDPSFSPGYGEEVDFSQRCVLAGLIHVAADDVHVEHRGEGSFGTGAAAIRADHEREIERRYPYYAAAVRAPRPPLRDALAAARRALEGISVTVEATALGPVSMGSQVTTLALIRALAATPARLRVVVPRGTRLGLDGVEVLHPDELELGVERTDVVHRPSQITESKQLDWLHRLGERIVITHQDLIAYANPGYFDSYASWDEHRTLTRQSLALADAVVFVSEYVRRDALAEELVTPERTHVVAQGVDVEWAPPRAPAVDLEPGFALCIGADFKHKNRPFAMRLFAELRRRGFDGRLVLAGPRMPHGSTRAEEAELADPAAVVTLDHVSEAEKSWLYENAAVVLYPTVSEGFGLVPFEAAHWGKPCMFAPVSSLPEVVGADCATIVPWDAAASAERAPDSRLVAARGETYTWQRTAAALTDVYRAALDRPAQAARRLYFGEALSDVALSLVGPGGYLPADVQRALLALSTRPALRRPAFALLRGSYRALHRRS